MTHHHHCLLLCLNLDSETAQCCSHCTRYELSTYLAQRHSHCTRIYIYIYFQHGWFFILHTQVVMTLMRCKGFLPGRIDSQNHFFLDHHTSEVLQNPPFKQAKAMPPISSTYFMQLRDSNAHDREKQQFQLPYLPKMLCLLLQGTLSQRINILQLEVSQHSWVCMNLHNPSHKFLQSLLSYLVH